MNNYHRLLASAPDHETPDFLTFLRKNNEVVYEDAKWLVIENYKYHAPERPWHTAFHKDNGNAWWSNLEQLAGKYVGWEWLIKEPARQTVRRFHVHFHKSQNAGDATGTSG